MAFLGWADSCMKPAAEAKLYDGVVKPLLINDKVIVLNFNFRVD